MKFGWNWWFNKSSRLGQFLDDELLKMKWKITAIPYNVISLFSFHLQYKWWGGSLEELSCSDKVYSRKPRGSLLSKLSNTVYFTPCLCQSLSMSFILFHCIIVNYKVLFCLDDVKYILSNGKIVLPPDFVVWWFYLLISLLVLLYTSCVFLCISVSCISATYKPKAK